MDNKKNYEFLMESLKTEQMTRNTGMELGILESYGHIGCISRVLRCHFFWIIECTIRKSNMATDIPPLDDFPDKKQHLLRIFTCHV